MRKFLAALLILGAPAFAVGPKFPVVLTFTASPSPGVSGYWLYWRQTNGVYGDGARWAVGTNAASGFDLRVLSLNKGLYWVAMSATNAAGSESDLSVEAVWDYTNPNPPVAVKVQ